MFAPRLTLAALLSATAAHAADRPDTLVADAVGLANARILPLRDDHVVIELTREQQLQLFALTGEKLRQIVITTTEVDAVICGNPN